MKHIHTFFCLLIVLYCFTSPFAVVGQDSTFRNSFAPKLEELLRQEIDYEGLWANAQVMTASRSVERIGTAPATIYVITDEQIKARGYTSLEDVLSDIPEIEIQQKANTYTNSYYTLRGIGGNERFVILQDGIRISSMGGALHPVQHNFGVAHAKQIEVILGPASALYGADAFSGIINIITKKGVDIKGAELRASYGRFNTTDNSFVAGATLKELSVMLYGKYYYSSEPNFPKFYPEDYNWFLNEYTQQGKLLLSQFDTSATVEVPIRPFQMPTQAYNVGVKIDIGENFTMGLSHNNQLHSTSVANRPEYTLYNSDVKYGTALTNVFASYQRSSENFFLRSIFSYNDFKVDKESNFQNVYSGYQPAYKYASESTFQFDQQFQYYFSDDTNITFGGLFQGAKALPQTGDLPKPFDPDSPERSILQYYIGTNVTDSLGNDLRILQNFYWTEYQNWGAYAQFKTRFGERLYFTLGSRYDYHTRYGGAFNPRLGLVFSPDEKFTVKLLYGEAFLAPSNQKTFQNFGNFIPLQNENGNYTGFSLPFYHLPNPGLLPERNRAFELNGSFALNAWLRIGIDAYYNSLYELITDIIKEGQEFKGIPVSAAEVSVNEGKSNTYGGTLQVNYHRKFENFALHTQFAYSFSDGDLRGEWLPLSAKHTLRWLSELSYKKIHLTPTLMYRSTSYHGTFRDSETGNPIGNKPFTVISLYGSYDLMQKSSVFFRIQNMLDKRFYHTSVPNVTTFAAVPQDPLRWTLGLSWKF